MNRILLAAAVWLLFQLFQGSPVSGATILFCPFESLDGWSVRSMGATDTRIVHDDSNATRFVEVTSRRGTVFLSRELPLEDVAGSSVEVRCLVQSEGVVPGPQLSSTGKIHLAVKTPGGVVHYNARFTGTSEWHGEGFSADVPEDAQRVVLNLGLEACFGKTRFDRLIVRNDKRGIHPLDLSRVANAGHEQLGIERFPTGVVEWEGIPFEIMDSAKHNGNDCLRLQGIGHDDWPKNTTAPIPVGTNASAIYILHGALDGRETSETPTAIWTAWFAGGRDNGLSLFEGRDIGAIGRTENANNWQVAWREKTDDGQEVTFGVTRWIIYSDAPLVSLSCRTYSGSPPVVLAVTVVEEPPPPPPEEGDDMNDDAFFNS